MPLGPKDWNPENDIINYLTQGIAYDIVLVIKNKQ